MSDEEHLQSVGLAIAAYQSDDKVIGLLESAFASNGARFEAVIVVDSQGSGTIPRIADERGWAIRYVNADCNLGSAGNLDLRLRTASELGLEWCFALNHDGILDPAKVRRLVEHGRSRPRVGAVYPQLIFSRAGNRPHTPRRRFSAFGFFDDAIQRGTGDGHCIEIAWSSSNGALYNLAPFREGVTAWPTLWMGFEDLAIGWELKRRGWLQLLCADVELRDDYEYRKVRIFGRNLHLAEKPSWYAYYQLRNLWLIARGSGGKAISHTSVWVRLIIDVALILVFRNHKRERLRLLVRGLIDGLRGITGKGPLP